MADLSGLTPTQKIARGEENEQAREDWVNNPSGTVDTPAGTTLKTLGQVVLDAEQRFSDVDGIYQRAVATISALKALTTSDVDAGHIIKMAGYNEAGDGADGTFRVLSGTPLSNGLIEDGGVVIENTANDLTFVRLEVRTADVRWWGAVPGARASASVNDTAFANAFSYCRTAAVPLLVLGNYFISDTLEPADGSTGRMANMVGVGSGYWPSSTAYARSTLSDEVLPAPSQITFTGSFTRDVEIVGISSMKECGAARTNPSAAGGGYNDSEYRLLTFTDGDVSVGVDIPKGTIGGYIRDIRFVLDQGGDDGLDGYEGSYDETYDELANSEVDVGILLERCPEVRMDNVYFCGPYRKTGRLILTGGRNGSGGGSAVNIAPYRLYARNCRFEGYKATSIRGFDSFKIVAITATTLDVVYADDHPFDENGGTIYLHNNQYAITGVDYTSATTTGSSPTLLRFSGLSADLTGSYSVGDGITPHPSGGSSAILDDNCFYGGYNHPSGYACHYGSLPNAYNYPGGGIEISGRLITEITFRSWQIGHGEQVAVHIHEGRELFFERPGSCEVLNTRDGNYGARFISSPQHSNNTYAAAGSAAYASGSAFNIWMHCGDLLFGEANDLRPNIPMYDEGRFNDASEAGFWEANLNNVPDWALSADVDQGVALRAPVGGRVGLGTDAGPSSGTQAPNAHDPEYSFNYNASDDELHAAKVVNTTKGVTSGKIVIADDAVGSITPPRNGGVVIITASPDTGSPQEDDSGIVFFDTGGSPLAAKWAGGGNFTAVSTDVTGSTGSDGNTTIGVVADTVKIENRSGTSRTYRYSFVA